MYKISPPPLSDFQLVESLLILPDLKARVNTAVNLITSNLQNMKPDLLRFAASSFYKKLKVADAYVPSSKYHGKVVLLRARTSSEYEQNLGPDYRLSEVRFFTKSFNFPLLELNAPSAVVHLLSDLCPCSGLRRPGVCPHH